jgi:hypothetical protein
VREELAATHPASIQYHLNPDLTLKDVVVSDVFVSTHARQADHRLSATELSRLRTITSEH